MNNEKSNGNVKWIYAVPLVLTMSLAFIAMIDKVDAKVECVKDFFHSIDKRLARIEIKLGIDSNEK